MSTQPMGKDRIEALARPVEELAPVQAEQVEGGFNFTARTTLADTSQIPVEQMSLNFTKIV